MKTCPWCETPLEAAGAKTVHLGETPAPGDEMGLAFLCAFCGGLTIVIDEGTHRPPTMVEERFLRRSYVYG